MFKVMAVCRNCSKESAAYDDGESVITFDFKHNLIGFYCPYCGYSNIMNLGDIEKALEQKTKLPKIGGIRY
jgi:hypothetical protein